VTPYTTTLTDEALRRGILVTMINPDPDLPIFDLSRDGKAVRCFNALTDRVGAATYHLVNNKRACHTWLASRRIAVPAQFAYDDARLADALRFLREHAPIVVKPCMQWGGRGISMGVRTAEDLRTAVRFARRYETDVILEETVPGDDLRVILVGGELAAAIRRSPAAVTGDGVRTIRQLIARRNAQRRKEDASNVIPWNAETRRNLAELGRSPGEIPAPGERVRVRLTNNYHTGGTVGVVTLENALEALVGQIQDEFDTEKSELVRLGENVWEAAGTLALHELEKIIGTVPHDESTTTTSGWVTEKLGGFPRAGDFVTVGEFELRVEEMDGPRVGKLKVTRKN